MAKIVVHGVHRSGTSLTASLLARAGCWYAELEDQMPSQEDNPKGFWERVDVVALNDEILAKVNLNWFTLVPTLLKSEVEELASEFGERIASITKSFEIHNDWFIKDPRFSVTWPLWESYLAPTHHIVVHRHPISVARSLRSRNGISIEHGLIFWYHQSRMIALALAGKTNVLNIEFGSQQYSGTGAVNLINSIVGEDDERSLNLSQSDFDSIYQSGLIHHGVHEALDIEQPDLVIEAWALAQKGSLQELAELPEISSTNLSWRDLDSRAAIGCQTEVSTRDFRQSQQQILELQQKNENLSVEIEAIKEQADELNLRLLKISGSLKKYMLSKRYMNGSLIGKILKRLKLAENKSLYGAFDIAVYGHSRSDLDLYVPKMTNRSLLLSAVLRDPVSFLRRINVKRTVKAVKVILGKGEADIGIDQALLQYANTDIALNKQLDIFDAENPGQWVDSVVEFEYCESPKVSIVIPVYNNYLTTLACLHSIKKHTDYLSISYEVVIADDCSTDETRNIGRNVPGLTVVRGETNQGFLRNCNSAIPEAKGKFIVLLNNDTNVQRDWLSELLLPLTQNEQVGVTGPMFLYPDGRLQEAGGIVFSDASGWNYGRLDQPSKAEYNFARDVDYISGACFMFRKTLWNDIGGFDEVFAPAYYEDTDFFSNFSRLIP